MNISPSLLALLLLSLPTCIFAEYKTFTNPEGASIEAKITSIGANGFLALEMSSGKKLSKVDPKAFSKKDQEYFAKWKKENAAKISERDFEILLNTSRGKTKREKKPVTTSGGTYYKNGKEIKTWPAFYRIKLKNISQHPLENLRMEYIIFKEADSMVYYQDKRKDLEMIRQKGTLKIQTITPMREIEVQTDSLPMQEIKYLKGIYALGSGDTKSKDDLAGIWLRIYNGKELVIEKIHPEKIARSEGWK